MYTPIPCQCSLDLNDKIKITEAEKKHAEGNKTTFVVYTIKAAEVKTTKLVWEKSEIMKPKHRTKRQTEDTVNLNHFEDL